MGSEMCIRDSGYRVEIMNIKNMQKENSTWSQYDPDLSNKFMDAEPMSIFYPAVGTLRVWWLQNLFRDTHYDRCVESANFIYKNKTETMFYDLSSNKFMDAELEPMSIFYPADKTFF